MKRERRTELAKKADWLAASLVRRWHQMQGGDSDNWYDKLADEEYDFVENHIAKIAEYLEGKR